MIILNLPSTLVPLVSLIFLAIILTSLFLHVKKKKIF